MNKKISLGLAIALIILSATATFAITMSVSQRMYNKLITDLPKRAQMYDAVEEVDKIVRSKYYGDIDARLEPRKRLYQRTRRQVQPLYERGRLQALFLEA